MNGRYTIEPSRRPMGIAARGGQWLLPWASVLVASATLAHAAEQELVGSSRVSSARAARRPSPTRRECLDVEEHRREPVQHGSALPT